MKLRNLLILFLPMLLIILYGSSHIPEGKLITSSVSPNGTYKVNAYRWDGGATTDTAIRGEVESLETGQKRNIYWQYNEYGAGGARRGAGGGAAAVYQHSQLSGNDGLMASF